LGARFQAQAFDEGRVCDAVENAETAAHHLVDDLLVVHRGMLRRR